MRYASYLALRRIVAFREIGPRRLNLPTTYGYRGAHFIKYRIETSGGGREVETSALVSRRLWVRFLPESPVKVFHRHSESTEYAVLLTRQCGAELNTLLLIWYPCNHNSHQTFVPNIRLNVSSTGAWSILSGNFPTNHQSGEQHIKHGWTRIASCP